MCRIFSPTVIRYLSQRSLPKQVGVGNLLLLQTIINVTLKIGGTLFHVLFCTIKCLTLKIVSLQREAKTIERFIFVL